MTLAILDRVVEQCKRAGVKPIVVLFPDYYPMASSLDKDWIKPNIREYLENKESAQVIDLFPAFLHYEGDQKVLFLPDNHHWSAAGHQIVAEELIRQIFPDGVGD